MAIEPKAGLVVRYDFLWKEEADAGIESGKDRPCAIVLVATEKADGSRDILLCAITHTPPKVGETAIRIPAAVARFLGLDDEQSWIKTDQVNRLNWPRDRIPYGISPARRGEWFFGMLPHDLGRQVFEQIREKAGIRRLRTVERNDHG